MKNILLCCNCMGIGGVETVILNQVLALSKKEYNVFVIAKKGEYSDKVEENGGHFIEMDFPEENTINVERVNNIVNIIKENSITEIVIHKYQCIPSMLVAAFITKTPYFAYEHGIINSKQYYIWNYPIYKSLFPIYYKNACKIIAITPRVAEDIKKDFDIKEEQCVIKYNGIDFNIFYNDNPHYDNTDIQQVFIVSRIDKEKVPTIYNGIDAFIEIAKIYPNAVLNIVGGGNAEKEIIEYLNDKKLKYTYEDHVSTVKFWGKQTNIKDFLKQADIFLGVDRCALEAIAMKVPVIITGYNAINGLITKENMNLAMEENFSGLNMQSIDGESLKKQLLELSRNRRNIINDVYNLAKEKLDCYEVYINIPKEQDFNIDWIGIFKLIEENNSLIVQQSEGLKAQYEWIQKIEEENKKLIQKNIEISQNNMEVLKIKDKEIDMKKQEINEIYNSKRWRYIEKVLNLFHKNNNAE